MIVCVMSVCKYFPFPKIIDTKKYIKFIHFMVKKKQ